jgi:ribonuclease VapC
MVLDSSALLAILLQEAGHETLVEKAANAERVFIGAPTAFETAAVLSSKLRRDPRPEINGILRRLNAEIVEFGSEHYEFAVSAFLRFGKGRHPAALNFGDCMSYALAAMSGEPLLFCGNDFSQTDIQGA